MAQKEIKPRAESRNFYVSLASLFLLSLGLASGEQISIEPGELIDSLSSGNVVGIVTLVFVNLLNPVMKLVGKVQRGEFNADFIRSPNFQTQALTVVLSGVTLVGIAFPPEAAGDVIEAVQTKDFTAIWIALGVNILNPVYHFIKKEKPEPEPVKA